MNFVKRAIRSLVPEDEHYEPEFLSLWKRCEPFTMTGIKRAYGLWLATRYAVRAGVPGDFIECGVWRGGSAMIMAHTLMTLNETRPLYLYDSYEGMAEPGEIDISHTGERATDRWLESRRGEGSAWCYAGVDEVRRNLASTGYPMRLVHMVPGKVEDTLPVSGHEQIAILRLDTDWYESTKVELETLYPRLAAGGVLIIDDYGHWAGAKKAVDEYLDGQLLLMRLDYTGRIAIKPHAEPRTSSPAQSA